MPLWAAPRRSARGEAQRHLRAIGGAGAQDGGACAALGRHVHRIGPGLRLEADRILAGIGAAVLAAHRAVEGVAGIDLQSRLIGAQRHPAPGHRVEQLCPAGVEAQAMVVSADHAAAHRGHRQTAGAEVEGGGADRRGGARDRACVDRQIARGRHRQPVVERRARPHRQTARPGERAAASPDRAPRRARRSCDGSSRPASARRSAPRG
ncbi:hypothetical protein SDC9_36088 [bioreactor metagenome]|uniref:Uncharacterized protein n=1 Tax=bioreactor metagenome TaxID=1076179 RepID=A0A644VHE5_9ZZZZ